MFFLQPAESSKDLGVRELLVFCYMGSVELPFIGTPSKQTLGFVCNFFLFFGGGDLKKPNRIFSVSLSVHDNTKSSCQS